MKRLLHNISCACTRQLSFDWHFLLTPPSLRSDTRQIAQYFLHLKRMRKLETSISILFVQVSVLLSCRKWKMQMRVECSRWRWQIRNVLEWNYSLNARARQSSAVRCSPLHFTLKTFSDDRHCRKQETWEWSLMEWMEREWNLSATEKSPAYFCVDFVVRRCLRHTLNARLLLHRAQRSTSEKWSYFA